MAEFGGVYLTQNTSSQKEKAEQLSQLVVSIANKIEEIDTEILNLARGGLQGESVQSMADSYLKNREVISDFVKRFAATAIVLYDDAQGAQDDEVIMNSAASIQ